MDLSPRYSNSDTHEDETPRFFGNGSEFRTTNGECRIQWEPLGSISCEEIHLCYLSGVGAPKIPAFQAPELVQEIHLDGFISHSNFSSLFRPLVNLKLLEIHISSFECLNIASCGNQLDLPCLECLDITSTNFTYYHGIRADMGGILENISAILTAPNNFPILTYLSVSTPTFPPMDEDFARSILHCIAAHKTTLKFLNIESEFALIHDNNGIPYDERFYSESPSKKDLNMTTINSAKDVELSSFHYFALAKSANTEIWKKFIETQNNLEYLQFWCESRHFPFPRELLRRNDSLIHTVALNVDVLSSVSGSPSSSTARPMIGTQVDLSVFQDSPYLKTLFLKGNGTCVSGPETMTHPNVINVEMLPETIEFLKLMHLLIDSDEIGFIATGLPKLNKLELTNIGEECNFGLRVSDLAILLQTNTIQKLEIVSSINRPSFTTQNNDHTSGYEVLAKILLSKQEKSTSIRVSRNANGGFDPMSEPEDEEDEDEDVSDEDEEAEETDEDAPCDPEEIVPAACVPNVVESNSCETQSEEDPCEVTITPSTGNNNQIEECQDSRYVSNAQIHGRHTNVDEEECQEPGISNGNLGGPIGSVHIHQYIDFPASSANVHRHGYPPPTQSTIELNVVRSGSNSSVIGIQATPGVDVEMVDAEEANLDMFVKDFARGQSPPS